jgi:hypothetical protein
VIGHFQGRTYTELKGHPEVDRVWLEKYVEEQIEDDGGEEYSMYEKGFEFEMKTDKSSGLGTLPPSKHSEDSSFQYKNYGQQKLLVSDELYDRLLEALADCLKPKRSSNVGGDGKKEKPYSDDDKTELDDADIKVIAECVRPYYKKGRRRPIVFGLSGLLHKSSISKDSAIALMETLAKNDKESDVRCSLSSFLIMWIATSIFLSQYRHKLGKIKYFSPISIPLIYYIFHFQNYFGDAIFSLLQSSPVFYSIIYILSFSATKQVGALLFSLSFWTAAALVYDIRVRQSLLLSSIGMAILFSSLEITPLQYRVFPPYGLITEAFIPIGSYLLFVGIFTSAKHISRDAELRKEFYKSAASQLTLLKAIGVSQMEKELEEETKLLEKHFKLSERGRPYGGTIRRREC